MTGVQTCALPIFDDLPITILSNICDVNHFLSLGNWFQEVEGLTGKEARNITRTSLPELRPLIRKSMDLYVMTKNAELQKEDSAVKIAMGDYNSEFYSPTVRGYFSSFLIHYFHSIGWSSSQLEHLATGATPYSKLDTDLITFCIVLATGAYSKYAREVPAKQELAIKAFVHALHLPPANTGPFAETFISVIYPIGTDYWRTVCNDGILFSHHLLLS